MTWLRRLFVEVFLMGSADLLADTGATSSLTLSHCVHRGRRAGQADAIDTLVTEIGEMIPAPTQVKRHMAITLAKWLSGHLEVAITHCYEERLGRVRDAAMLQRGLNCQSGGASCASVDESQAISEALREFALADSDKSGTISKAEFLAAYGEQGAAEFDQADTDKDGELSIEEYKVAFLSGLLSGFSEQVTAPALLHLLHLLTWSLYSVPAPALHQHCCTC